MLVGSPSIDAARVPYPAGLGGRVGWDGVLFAAAALWGALYYLHFQFAWTGIFPGALSDVPVHFAVAVVASQAAWCARSGTRLRRAWAAFAGAYVCYTIGDVFYYQGSTEAASLASGADFLYCSFYVLAFAGAVQLRERPAGRLERLKLGLDSATILLGSAALFWYFLLRPIAAGRGVLEATLATAYPAGDLVLVFAAIVPLATRCGHVRRHTCGFLILGFLMFFVADVSFALRSLKGDYEPGHWSDWVWTVSSLVVMAAARWSRRTVEAGDAATEPGGAARFVALLPYVAIAAVAGLLLFVSHDVWGQPLGGAVLASLGVTALVVARQVLASRENARLLTERAALQGEARFQSLVQNSFDVISIVDRDGRYRYLSPSVEPILGYPQASLLEKSFTDLIHPEEVQNARAFLSDLAARPGNRESTVLRALHHSGRWLYVEVVGLNLATDPNVNGLLLTVRDVTERKDLREAKAAAESANRAKSQFLANMSHEIRTPLNGVLGTTELLVESGLTPSQRRLAELARSSGESLLSIVDDILDFSRIEAGRLELEQVGFDLRETVEGVVELLAERARAKDVELLTLVAADVPNVVRGDPGRLRQVLVNLVGNAVKFTARGEIVVRVAVLDKEGPSTRLAFEVRDTGVGIAPEALSRIFDAFVQADASTTRRYGGTGLGLAICRQLVDLMGGAIEVESTVGVGTTFRFTACFGRQLEAVASPWAVRAAAQESPKVLVLDDNATNRFILGQQCAHLGIRSDGAADGPEALAMLREAAARGEAYDLAILDMHMPEMDGLEVAAAIQADAGIAAVRLVLLTSLSPEGRSSELEHAGIAERLTKPVRESQLRDCVLRVLGPADGSGSAAVAAADEGTAGVFEGVVLLVEDNAVNQAVAEGMLRQLGCRVELATNGHEALAALARTRYDVVLMDCMMPGMDGYEATAALRHREAAEARRTPVIALTANAMTGDRDRCIAAGMDDYMSKPFRQAELRRVLARWVPQARPEMVH